MMRPHLRARIPGSTALVVGGSRGLGEVTAKLLAAGGAQVIKAHVPLSEMFGYATDMRSKTQGRATYTMEFSHYEKAPKSIEEEIVAKAQGKKPAA